MPASPAVDAAQITKLYGGGAGVEGVDISVETGSIVGLIGPSGSGKTTTVRIMTGLLEPDSGTVTVLGENPARFKRSTRARIGYMPQDSILYPALTLRQNLDFAGTLYGMRKGRRERVEELIEFVELDDVADRIPRRASGGEKRRISLAATLIHSPDVVFLDEPTAGLDPVLRRKFWDRFEELARGGRTLVVTTQYVGEAAYCDYVAVLAAGRVLTVATPDDLRRQAYGGEMVDVRFGERPSASSLDHLDQIASGEMAWIDASTIRLVVDDSGQAIPELLRWADDNDVDVAGAESYIPPFDDTFVELVSRSSVEAEPVDV